MEESCILDTIPKNVQQNIVEGMFGCSTIICSGRGDEHFRFVSIIGSGGYIFLFFSFCFVGGGEYIIFILYFTKVRIGKVIHFPLIKYRKAWI